MMMKLYFYLTYNALFKLTRTEVFTLIHTVQQGETLTQIARDYRTPLSAIISANPSINPNVLYIGQSIVIPGFPDPNTLPYQIEISINNRWLRLLRDGVLQKQYPIAVGRILYNTPVGDFIIINKAPNPGGPFGTMWMSLSKEHYGIHGTNDPSSIGKAVSRGCIRMYNKDVEELARTIPIGTPVFIHP
jgi:L,D-transpeptidase ErfK/SrfK